MRLLLKYTFSLLILLSSFATLAQERCGTVAFNEPSGTLTQEESKHKFESWLERKKSQHALRTRASNFSMATIYQIPVVVHVVHNGDAYGDVGNIPDEQIISQITTLNEDFRRTNADQINTPAEFLPVAADIEIEFVLAKRDPEGLPTNGIVRVLGNQEGYTINEAEILAANSYWPAEDYFNVWVADLKHGNGDGLLGFAKYPVSDVEGLDENSTGEEPTLNREIDGVYMDYEYFGTGFNTDPFSRGRTMTHEVGHWLGLRHIWGDGGCTVDDYCDDTPAQSGSSSFNKTCSDLEGTNTCTSEAGEDMFQNYLDYTADECMNLFTLCQKDRMRTVLENSPRRKDLLSSQGTVAPNVMAIDLGIRAIESPSFGNCSLVLAPEVEVRNYGADDITEFSIDLLVDDVLVETLTTIETLTPLQSLFVNFSSITISEDAEMFSFKVNQVNQTTDQNPDNDCKWISSYFPSESIVPFVEDFSEALENGNSVWHTKNSNDNAPAWGFATAPQLTVDNAAAVLNYHGAGEESFGEIDYLISPVFDLSDLATADIRFKYAYAMRAGKPSDALTVVVSTDCGATFPEDQVIFRRIGPDLTTTSGDGTSFVPEGPGDWRDFEWNISAYAGSEVVIAFIGSNGGGDNIYVDDVEVFSTAAHDLDIAIASVESLSVVTCDVEVEMEVGVKNLGKQTITSFVLEYGVDEDIQSTLVDGLNLVPGQTEVVALSPLYESAGSYQMTIEASQPNGGQDQDLTNNSQVNYFIIDEASDVIPTREKFTSTLESSDWNFIRTDAPTDWTITTFGEGVAQDHAATFMGYEITELGIDNWLVSPMLDFSYTSEASMTFDVSYANKVGRNDQLRLMVSTNCGETFPFEVYNKKGGELAVTSSETAWLPDSLDDWREEFVSLNNFVGGSEIRVAFVVTNQNGNNLYLDNIEFYESADKPIEIQENMRSFPNPASEYVEVKFNFNIKEEIILRIVSLQGEVVAEETFPNTLNQVYRLNQVQNVRNGVYLLQVLGKYTNLSDKIMIQR